MLPDHFMYHDPIKHQARLSPMVLMSLMPLMPLGHIARAKQPLFSSNAGKYLKNLSLSINSRHPAPEWIVKRGTEGWYHLSTTERMALAHDHALHHVQDDWIKAIQLLFRSIKAPE